jgi:hypothetical protein
MPTVGSFNTTPPEPHEIDALFNADVIWAIIMAAREEHAVEVTELQETIAAHELDLVDVNDDTHVKVEDIGPAFTAFAKSKSAQDFETLRVALFGE